MIFIYTKNLMFEWATRYFQLLFFFFPPLHVSLIIHMVGQDEESSVLSYKISIQKENTFWIWLNRRKMQLNVTVTLISTGTSKQRNTEDAENSSFLLQTFG